MGKYVYLCFTKWTRKAVNGTREEFMAWRKKHDELCKENDVKVKVMGSVFGAVEDSVIGYATDMHRDAFQEFRSKIWNIDQDQIEYTKTYQVLSSL